jgi:hypothetical protein
MASKMADALRSAYDDGVREGESKAYREILTLLENEYMLGEYPRGSVEAKAILQVAGKLGQKMRENKARN